MTLWDPGSQSEAMECKMKVHTQNDFHNIKMLQDQKHKIYLFSNLHLFS